MYSACLRYVTKGLGNVKCCVLKRLSLLKRMIYITILVFLFPLPVSYPSFVKIYPREIFKISSFAKINPREFFLRLAFAKMSPREN